MLSNLRDVCTVVTYVCVRACEMSRGVLFLHEYKSPKNIDTFDESLPLRRRVDCVWIQNAFRCGTFLQYNRNGNKL